MTLAILATLLVLAVSSGVPVSVSARKRYYPASYKGAVIGILTQKTYKDYTKYGHSYIAASYVKFIEMAGAQVIPVFDSWDADRMNRTLNSINGMLFPGGAQTFPDSQYYKSAKFIYDWTLEMNKNGMHFPLWGTCLGFEAILYAAAHENIDASGVMFSCDAHMSNNLTLTDGAQSSRLLKNISSKLYEAIQVQRLVYNSHYQCVDKKAITNDKGPLSNKFNLLAVGWDSNGLEYTALVEHKTYPVYASQFHPEKNPFEWSVYLDIPHSQNAIFFTQYLANFFVDEAKKNDNHYSDAVEFYQENINNFSPVYTLIKSNTTIESCYFFKDKRPDMKNYI